MRVLMLIVAALVLVNLSACHTMYGFGQDLQQVGGKIDNKAAK